MTDTISRLIYVGDPMCSWCWGFAPEIEALSEEFPLSVIVGGLRPGPMAQKLDEGMAGFLRHHWVEIAERTGQPFDTSFLDAPPEDWVYDTEPAAMAIVQLREMRPDQTLDYFTDIQEAFYARSEDVTDFDVLSRIAASRGVDVSEFRGLVDSEQARKMAWDDFSKARNWGISGFPTLVGDLADGRLALLARGYAPADTIRERISSIAATVG